MTLFKKKYRVETARLKGWDYAAAGWYFVTLCTRGREHFFGEVVEGEMRLTGMGDVVAEEWCKTPSVRPNVELDEWIVMPNHLHGIIVINSTDDPAGRLYESPPETRFARGNHWSIQIHLHQTDLGRGSAYIRLAAGLLRSHHSQREIAGGNSAVYRQ